MEMNKRIIDMTLGELLNAIDEHMNEKPTGPVRMVYGIRGIMQLFNCSYSTAQRIKASGQIDGAISQVGRKITVNADRAIELYNLQNPQNYNK